MFSSIIPIGKWRHIFFACFVAFFMTALASCGGGSSGGTGSGVSDDSGESGTVDNGDETDTGATAENTAPDAAINGPLDGAIYTYGTAVTFTGSGTDAEDGTLSGASLVWTSDLDDEMGTGASLSLDDLSWGDHAITLTATDSGGETGSDSILLSVKAWIHPADATDNISPDGEDADEPRVAMNASGDAVIVWTQSDGSNDQIFMSEYRDGTWTHPAGLADNISPDGQDAGAPRVAMDESGNTVITWYQSDGSNYQIFKSEYRSGTWIHPADLSRNISPDGQGAVFPQVAMDANGNAIITWRQFDGFSNQIFKSEYRNGGWTYPTDLADNISPDGQYAWTHHVAMDDSGDAIITWYQSDGSKNQIFKSEYRNGKWTHPAGLADNISPDEWSAVYPRVAMDGSGNAVIVWCQSDGSDIQTFKSEYRSGAWTHPADLADNISPDGQDEATYPQVAMDANGNALIVWYQTDGSNDQIFISEYRNGAWAHPADLTDNISPDGEDTYSPRVAMDESGNAVIVWHQSDGSDGQVFKSEYRNGAWTHPAGLADNISPDGGSAKSPDVAMDGGGNAIITGLQSDGSNRQIFISEYY